VGIKVKIPVLACVLLCLFAAPAFTKDQPFQALSDTAIVIEVLDSDAKSLGLSEDSLKNQVFVALKRDVPKLRIAEEHSSAYVYVNISVMACGSGFASFVEVSLNRQVFLQDNLNPKSISIWASVWNKRSTLTGPSSTMAARINTEIANFLTDFAAQYYKDNP
jgi:hypothetical protein